MNLFFLVKLFEFHRFHRPVVALIEIEIQKVDWSKQSQVHDTVMKAMGPADPTIVVTSDGGDDEDAGIDLSELLDAVEPYGTVVLVRWAAYHKRLLDDVRASFPFNFIAVWLKK